MFSIPARGALLALAWACLLGPEALGTSRNVQILVERDLYAGGQVTASLEQYLADVRAQGFNPTLYTGFSTSSTPEEVRAYLADAYASHGLAGAVMVGHLPVGTVYTRAGGGIGAEAHPSDLYFTDLDGSWTVSGYGGILPDMHTDGDGDVGPEIWLGRLTAWNLAFLHPGRTEAGLINDYLAKNHAYRTGALTAPPTGLSYTDDDWDHVARAAALALAVTGPVTDVWNDPAVPGDQTTATDYKERLKEPREHVLVSAHSTSTIHSMSGALESDELAEIVPRSLFYHLYACSAARYTDFGYLAGEYVFGAGDGLVAVGPTKTGGMMSDSMPIYFGNLGEGMTFGEAMLDWWTTFVDPDGHTDLERAWYYGMTVIGDPMLVTQAHVPEPATGAIAALTSAGLLIRRRRRRD